MQIDSRVRHIDRVVSTIDGRTVGSAFPIHDVVMRSWHRSSSTYKLQPSHAAKIGVLTRGSLKDHREPLQGLLAIVRHGMAMLHVRLREESYLVMFSDLEGISIETLCEPDRQRQWEKLGLLPGACWSEAEEGTNAVGTCIAEQTPLAVHKDDHFCAANIEFSCVAAPVFDAEGRMVGVLDATALGASDDRRNQLLILELLRSHATLIENAHFLDRFRDHWILNFNRARHFLDVQAEHLLALDHHGRIVAANRSASLELSRGNRSPLLNAPIDGLFDLRVEDIPRLASEFGLPTALHTMQSSEVYFGSFRPPRKAPTRSVGPAAQPTPSPNLRTLAGADLRMQGHVNKLMRVLDRDIAILLTGETGTGKELLARAIHDSSKRAGRPFVAINCAAIPDSLIESELFGHRAGAFTGASSKGHCGCIERSSGGTLFLDEIGDMPSHLQSRLLRVMAEGEVTPLGAQAPVKVDLHVICATHCHLPTLVAKGHFREDLYYRLAGLTIELPALRERSDREALVGDILRQEAQAQGPPVRIDAEALAALSQHAWPGNLRQLRSVLRLAVSLQRDGVVHLADLPCEIVAPASAVRPVVAKVGTAALQAGTASGGGLYNASNALLNPCQRAERDVLLASLRQHQWQARRAAEALQMSRATLYRKMKRLHIVSPNRGG